MSLQLGNALNPLGRRAVLPDERDGLATIVPNAGDHHHAEDDEPHVFPEDERLQQSSM